MSRAAQFEKSDTRGVPSLVWRAGQNRRLEMIRRAAGPCLTQSSWVLVDGSGIGMYIRALRRYSDHVVGLDIEPDRAAQSRLQSPLVNVANGERLPYPANTFDLLLSHEVIEHVGDDVRSVADMVRVLKPGGRTIIFCPNRLYPFETHGHYWRGHYHFGNTPFINYLPDPLRHQLAPHVRAYTRRSLRKLLDHLPVTVIEHTQIYHGFDNIVARYPRLGRLLRRITYSLENGPLRVFGLSHLLVIEKK
mgnify:FL=1